MIAVKECVFIDKNGVRISYDELITLKEKSSTMKQRSTKRILTTEDLPKHTHPTFWEE